MGLRLRTVAVAMAATSCAVTLGSCGGGVQTLDIPKPPATSPPPPAPPPPGPTTTAVESGVAGLPTTTLPSVRPGNASLNGTVFGPEGPVKGATVLAERFVGGAIASVEARTASDGSWTISDVLGGQYRVRAWLAPGLADTTPQFVYLSEDQVLSISIEVSQFTGPVVASSMTPSVPMVGDPVNLAIQVTSPEVGADGVVRNLPVVGTPVVVEDDPGWTVSGSATETTAASGVVVFRLTCNFAGDNPLSVAVGSQPPDPLQLPVCASPPPAPTTTIPTTTTTIAPTPHDSACDDGADPPHYHHPGYPGLRLRNKAPSGGRAVTVGSGGHGYVSRPDRPSPPAGGSDRSAGSRGADLPGTFRRPHSGVRGPPCARRPARR